MTFLDPDRLAVPGNDHYIPILDRRTLKQIQSLGPVSATTHMLLPICPDDGAGKWALSAGGPSPA